MCQMYALDGYRHFPMQFSLERETRSQLVRVSATWLKSGWRAQDETLFKSKP